MKYRTLFNFQAVITHFHSIISLLSQVTSLLIVVKKIALEIKKRECIVTVVVSTRGLLHGYRNRPVVKELSSHIVLFAHTAHLKCRLAYVIQTDTHNSLSNLLSFLIIMFVTPHFG